MILIYISSMYKDSKVARLSKFNREKKILGCRVVRTGTFLERRRRNEHKYKALTLHCG